MEQIQILPAQTVLIIVGLVLIFTAFEYWKKQQSKKKVHVSTIGSNYYTDGNPQLGLGPVHQDGHGNQCDCWSCWSQTHGP